jgi:nucleoid-associated protein YgaU
MNPQEKENRAEQRDEKPRDERRKDKEKGDKSPRLGKEAKIGAAVILGLLVIFAAAVVVRMTKGESDDKQLAANADKDGGKHKPPKDDLFGDMSAKSFGGHQPTRVPPAKDGSTPMPGSIDSKLDRWKMPEKSEPKQAVSRYAPVAPPSIPPSAPPSFAPDPPKPNRGSRYDLAANDTLPGLEPEKPSRFDKKPSKAPFDSPEVKKRPAHADSVATVTTRNSFERGESSGFADAGAPPPREKSRYDEPSAALMAPAPTRDNPMRKGDGGRSNAGSLASRYDDDLPSASAPPPYDRGRSARFDSPSYGGPSSRRGDGKYEIQPGDSYSLISEKFYGTGAYYQALAEQNRGKFGNPNRLTPGEVISTPSVAQLEKSYPELCPKASRRETQESRTMTVSSRGSHRGGRTYTVSEGDTLFNIARYELGKAARWAEIYDMNREVLGKDFNYLTPGMKLVLPDNERSDVLTRKSSELYR